MLKRKTTFLIIAIALLIISTVSFSIAQFIDRQKKQNLAVSNNFIFKLNYADNMANVLPYYIVGNQINIKISNTDGLNLNSSNITYSVKVENSVGIDITNLLTITGEGGRLTGGVACTDNIFISGIVTDSLYVVKISSTSPYTKTLSAKFMLKSETNTYYTITDYGPFITLDLFVGSVMPTNNLTINYGLNLAPDNTNSIMETWLNNTSGIITPSSLTQNSTYSFTFVEQNILADYTKSATLLDLTNIQTITLSPN